MKWRRRRYQFFVDGVQQTIEVVEQVAVAVVPELAPTARVAALRQDGRTPRLAQVAKTAG